MELSNWTSFNGEIKRGYTVKKFFSKYLYKLTVYAPAGRLITKDGNMVALLDETKQRIKSAIKTASSYTAQYLREREQHLRKADVEWLEALRDIYNNESLPVKICISEQYTHFYATTEQELLDLVSQIDKTFYRYLDKIFGPESANAEKLLNENVILRKKANSYTHKIILRDGKYDVTVKNQLKEYFAGFGPAVVKVPRAVSRALDRTTLSVWGMYIYTNDPGIATFINIIHPGLVRNCHELATPE
ncbi:MAG TPA: hypothetical protein VFM18_18560 [Methanosarcina sp.]|nr:hypothetical protein [Methanosarcina sp.]